MNRFLIIIATLFAASRYHAQVLPFSPYMVNTTGGSGNAGANLVDYTIGESFIVFGGTGCDSVYSGFQHLAEDSLWVKKVFLSANGPTVLCSNTVVTLSVPATTPATTSYSWSNGATTQAINVYSTAVFSATLTNGCGNKLVTNSISVVAYPVPTPSICLVTVDSIGAYNKIFWVNNDYPQADSFYVMREIANQNQLIIGRVPKTVGSFIDNNFNIGGTFNGNPVFSSYSYRIQIKDTCGKLSNLGKLSNPSESHTSIFITDLNTGTFSYNTYKINSVSLATANYNLCRWDITNGTSFTVASSNSLGGNIADPLWSTLAQNGNVKWYVATSGFACAANLGAKGSEILGTITKTKSNNTNERLSGFLERQINLSAITLYPNPANKTVFLNLNTPAKDFEYKIVDVTGRIISIQILESHKQEIQLEAIPAGLYFINIYSGTTFICSKKLVLER